jgi:hypothetical protein
VVLKRSVIALESSLALRPRRVLASWWGWHKDWRSLPVLLASALAKGTTFATCSAGARHPDL